MKCFSVCILLGQQVLSGQPLSAQQTTQVTNALQHVQGKLNVSELEMKSCMCHHLSRTMFFRALTQKIYSV